MKRFTRAFGAFLLLSLLLFVQAAPLWAAISRAQLVNDEAGILTAGERADLEAQADAILDEYGLEVRIVTVPAMQGTTDAYTYATSLYNAADFGAGADKSGILLLLSMEARDYALIAHGDGNSVLTDYGNEQMADSFLKYFGDDDWAGGFEDYLTTASDYCHQYYVEGEVYDYSLARSIGRLCIGFAVIGAPLIGASAVWVMVQQMKTARKQTHAEFYVDRSDADGDGLTLTDQSDDFIFTQTIITQRPQANDNPLGGGTTVGSGGFSGSAGKF